MRERERHEKTREDTKRHERKDTRRNSVCPTCGLHLTQITSWVGSASGRASPPRPRCWCWPARGRCSCSPRDPSPTALNSSSCPLFSTCSSVGVLRCVCSAYVCTNVCVPRMYVRVCVCTYICVCMDVCMYVCTYVVHFHIVYCVAGLGLELPLVQCVSLLSSSAPPFLYCSLFFLPSLNQSFFPSFPLFLTFDNNSRIGMRATP